MHTSKLVNKPIELEASSIQLLRRLQFDNRLSSIPRLTSKGGNFMFINWNKPMKVGQRASDLLKISFQGL